MEENRNLEKFVEKILEIQTQQNEKVLDQTELKRIAGDMGMSENEWMALQKTFNDHVTRSKSFLNYKNWADAIEEGEQAIILNPYHPEALITLSVAYSKRWQSRRNPKDKEMAIKYADDCLNVDPSNEEAAKLVSQLKSQRSRSSSPLQHPMFKVDVPNSTAVLVLGILSLIICYINPILAIISLVLSGKAQSAYLLDPQRYTLKSYKNMRTGKILAIISLSLSALVGLIAIIAQFN